MVQDALSWYVISAGRGGQLAIATGAKGGRRHRAGHSISAATVGSMLSGAKNIMPIMRPIHSTAVPARSVAGSIPRL